jgi:hypothetical protein
MRKSEAKRRRMRQDEPKDVLGEHEDDDVIF